MTANRVAAEPDELAVQADVLSLLLRHQRPVAIEEINRELAEPIYGPYPLDAVAEATRDLAHVGLIHRHGSFAFPTRAAAHYSHLPHR